MNRETAYMQIPLINVEVRMTERLRIQADLNHAGNVSRVLLSTLRPLIKQHGTTKYTEANDREFLM